MLTKNYKTKTTTIAYTLKGVFMNSSIFVHPSSNVSESCVLTGEVKIGKNCVITNSRLQNCIVGDNVKIVDSTIEESEIKNNATIGPYSHLRPGTIVGEGVHIGNFVEIKNAKIGNRTKIPHLSYVGDCDVGEDVNIGCGVIFCNYDGKNKNRSFVGNRVFIGSNSNLVAPVIVEDDSFIAAGTTVTDNVLKGEFCIGRVKNETRHGVLNLYLQNFTSPLKYFGTDGIRGIYGETLNDELCKKVGYSLTKIGDSPKILIGRDTRESGTKILNNLAIGVCSGGGEVYDAGVISTAGVAYLTKFFDFDYGVMITASHNPSEYNGIKIFNKNGYKLNENQEILLEKHLILPKKLKKAKIKIAQADAYIEHLKSVCTKKVDLKIFLDCSNGAVSGYAPALFKSLGAKVEAINISGEINKDASVLDENLFVQNMKKSEADIGFCFDGDADRIMCITQNGIVLDGDKILYILAKYRKEKFAVGTIMSNMALEKHLMTVGTRLVRTDVGDKYIARLMKSKKYKIGAEQSGHVIISDLTTTGDGVLTALYLLNIFIEQREIFDKAEQLNNYSTVNLKVKTENKKIIKNDKVSSEIKKQEKLLAGMGRIIVRPSGTEPVIRITVESKNQDKSKKIANKIKSVIESVND